MTKELKIAVVGLGYVGLPLAVAFGKRRSVVGFDININRVAELRGGSDSTRECSSDDMASAEGLTFTSEVSEIADARVYIVTVPTPIDSNKRPDLEPLKLASKTVGSVLKKDDLVIYESTVYPGVTEDVCVPILETTSGLALNRGFYCGYSPERINPGDKVHRLENIVKITSGSCSEAASAVDNLYKEIISAGTFKAKSIKVAEAAKVIENTQRDLNIALINELSMIFQRLNIDTYDVLDAAGTKWNFLPFRPGLVGGHCIGVDPYYLTHKAQEVGYHPELILAGRRINDNMPKYIASSLIKAMVKGGIEILGARVLVLGFSFKENCPDIRNTKVVDLINDLLDFGMIVDVFDPVIRSSEAQAQYGLSCFVSKPNAEGYDAIVVAVGHDAFDTIGIAEIQAWSKPQSIIYDVKGFFDSHEVTDRL